MSERETVPDRLRAMADQAAEQGNGMWESAEHAATAFRVGLAQCVATLRMAAAAWPDEQAALQARRNADWYAPRLPVKSAEQRIVMETPDGISAPFTLAVVAAAREAAAVWRESRKHPQATWEPVGEDLAAALDLLAQAVQ